MAKSKRYFEDHIFILGNGPDIDNLYKTPNCINGKKRGFDQQKK